jgi:hypothetical protein
VGSGGGNLPAAPEAGRHRDLVVCHLHHPLFDKEGERGVIVAGRHVILGIEEGAFVATGSGRLQPVSKAAVFREFMASQGSRIS